MKRPKTPDGCYHTSEFAMNPQRCDRPSSCHKGHVWIVDGKELQHEQPELEPSWSPMLTDEQRETWRAWRRAVDLIAAEGVRIDQHPKLADALEAWAIAYAEASR